MKPLSLKISSHHLLLCVFLSLLWGVTDSTTTSPPDTMLTPTVTSSTEEKVTTLLTTPLTIPLPSPRNSEEFRSTGQKETSITLEWKKVDDILDYILLFNGTETNFTASEGTDTVTHTIPNLTSATKYNFTLFTVYANIRSSGVSITAFTAPRNSEEEEFRSIGQKETSITLEWKKVDDILNYTLLFNGTETNVTASEGTDTVTHTIPNLTSATEHNFTLFTVYENIRSSGVSITAFTAPGNSEEFKSIGQNETSITLERKKGVTDSTTASSPDTMLTPTVTSSTEEKVTTLLTTPLTIPLPPPRNSEEFRSIGQNETSITLEWKKVDDILNYTLLFNGTETNFTASEGTDTVTHTIPNLTSATEHNFTLFTVRENIRSSGVSITAFTDPGNAKKFKSIGQNETSITMERKEGVTDSTTTSSPDTMLTSTVTSSTEEKVTTLLTTPLTTPIPRPPDVVQFKSIGQNETSITLEWKKVDDILNYTLLFNGTETNFTASDGKHTVTHTIPNLASATKYNFTLFTVRENTRSSGVNIIAPTAPPNADQFKTTGQNETSITLKWKKVDNILDYILLFNETETNVNASKGKDTVTHTIPNLTSATKYNFTLFTVYENIRSSGINITAFTAPRNSEEFKSIGQNETSITLEWKKVDDILNYTLLFNGTETNFTASDGKHTVTHTIPNLTSATKYDFTLFTVYENIRSSGENITAFTAPRNSEEFKSIGQNETSITLEWKKVDDILNYTLLFNGAETNFTASEGKDTVTHTIPNLTSATKYDFTLFTVYENIRSSGENITAPTAPRNSEEEEFKSIGQNETSITLEWKKVDDILNYTLLFNGTETNFTASDGKHTVTHTIPNLTSATKYNFTLFTVYENIRSSGISITAFTAPRNSEEFRSIGQNETSITLEWKKVDDILNYTLLFNGTETNFTASEGTDTVTHTIPNLTSVTKYNFTLFTVYENIRSSGVSITAFTAPRNSEEFKSIGQNETSITLEWKKVDDILNYTLLFNGAETNFTASDGKDTVTHTIPNLTSGTIYNFTLFTVFENIRSIGVSITNATVPSMVTLVDVTERKETRITLAWNVDVDKDWSYYLQINEENVPLNQDRSKDVFSHSVSPLQPGTRYNFSVITTFYGLNSTVYRNFTVTAINCACETWRVNTSSVHGKVEGLVSTANVTNTSYSFSVTPEDGNVLLTDLYPGAAYTAYLEYETENRTFEQCNCTKTTQPRKLDGSCKYWAAGYSALIVWNEPDSLWTKVQIMMNGKTHYVTADEEQQKEISGLLPARTYEVSVALISGDETSEPHVFQCKTDPTGVIAGAVFGVLLFGVLVCLVVFIIRKWPDIISRQEQFICGSKVSNKKPKAVSVAKFPDHFYRLSADENRGFSQEYESLSPVGTEQARKEATQPENKARNRFNNVLPYDWCRVKLSTSSTGATSDYINANYMPGYDSNREYIATQGPLPTTVNDFWRMIWEQRVKRIVMVTNCIEGGRTKCEQYWPAENEPCLNGELVVTMRSEQQEPNWTLRDFRLKHSNSSEERTVKHFHFTAWPDHGVPQCTEVLIQFRELVRQHIQREGAVAPSVVHCSAGVGRTGTIIALDVLLQQLEKERAVGINSFVHKMRLSRPHMVQTESQYIFLHQCIMDCLQPKEKTEENIYENADMIYANATALQELHTNP